MPATRLLAVLTSDPLGPVVRHRWTYFAEALEAAGIVLEVVPWPKGLAGRRQAFQRVTAADGVVVSSRLLRRSDVRRVRRRARRLAFDFDDALPFRDSARKATASRTRRRRFAAIVKASDAVFAGNAYLGELAAAAGRKATVLPTVVRMGATDDLPRPADGLPVLGWIGSRSTVRYLDGEWVTLSAIVASGRPIRLRVIADARPSMPPGIAVEVIPWTREGWRRALAGIHLGLAPLPDDAWTRGKCGLKVLQTLSVGRPVVASAVGVQREQVVHGETGFLATSQEEFFESILHLLDDPERARRMGRAGLEDVRARYSVAAWAPRVVETIASWLEGAAA